MSVTPVRPAYSLMYSTSSFLDLPGVTNYISKTPSGIGTVKSIWNFTIKGKPTMAPISRNDMGLSGSLITSHFRMSVVQLFFKPEGTYFAFASILCTLKNTMTFCF